MTVATRSAPATPALLPSTALGPVRLRPLVSVVVPAYDEADYLPEALTSLLAQDLPEPYEVIVVDNGSSDGTADLAWKHGVRVVHEPRRGVCAARQRGAEVARGDILVSTDADADTVHPPSWLRDIVTALAADPDAVAVGGPCRYDDGRAWTRWYPVLLFGLVQWLFRLTGVVVYVTATNLAVRRSAFPGYNLQQTQGGDELDLLRRLRRQGRVLWDDGNAVTTSARRLQRGLLHSFFVSFLTYYLVAYGLNRLTRRSLLGTAPAIRSSPTSRVARRHPGSRVDVVHRVATRSAL